MIDETSNPDRVAPPSVATHRFRRIQDAHRMVAELREGDGVDPRMEHRHSQRKRSQQKADHAAQRLASQILRCAQTTLINGLLADLEVRLVTHGKGNHFIIELGASDPTIHYDLWTMQEVANSRLPSLRNALAREIHRKKVPTLSIHILPCPIVFRNLKEASNGEASSSK